MAIAIEDVFEIDPEAPVLLEPVPPEETIWRKHSANLEMPTSLVISTLMMVVMFGGLVLFMLYAIAPGPEKRVPTINLADAGGDDEAGLGMVDAGGGGDGKPEPIKATTTLDPEPSPSEQLPLPELPEVTARPEEPDLTDPTAVASAEPSAPSQFGTLDDLIREKQRGGSTATGDGPGKEGTGPNAGPRGTGADKTMARATRWRISFRTQNGRDYLDQLSSLGALILIPTEGNSREYYIFRDLKNPKPGTIATGEEISATHGQIHFSEPKRDQVSSVAQALGLRYTPSIFFAVFPKGLEEDMAAQERAYRGLRPEDVEETRFEAVYTNGRCRLKVTSQTPKNR